MHIESVLSRQSGVTLIELLVTMSIVVIVLTVGVSGMSTMVKRNSRATEVNAMIGHLNFARAQAILLGRDVMVCPIDTDDLASGCAGGTDDWVDGYAVIDSAGDVLRLESGSRAVTIRSTQSEFRFQGDGTLSGVGGNFLFCDAKDNAASDAARSEKVIDPIFVIVSRMGRLRTSEKNGSGNEADCS
jgi:type IV fimbrial biogenesis protein FimT